MLKPTGAFKLSKTTKRMLSNFVDNESRNHWKRMMIQAELAEKIVIKPSKKERGTSNYNTTTNAAVSTD
jgi:16S rRNA A1518/A1519 N6-dimethyltransferase RsmA/KsgA/DIM1 with predicted DNA glycosylase/AP lyase activity